MLCAVSPQVVEVEVSGLRQILVQDSADLYLSLLVVVNVSTKLERPGAAARQGVSVPKTATDCLKQTRIEEADVIDE